MSDSRSARVSARYWIDIAIADLCEGGPDALTIEALCRSAKKTKGSFYAHFDNYNAFLSALVTHWEEQNTAAVIRDIDDKAPAHDRLVRLNYLALRLDTRLDQRMRELADRNPHIAQAVAEVVEIRIAYLADLYRATGDFSQSDAKDLATIEYAAYVGLMIIGPKRETQELERLYQAFLKAVSVSAAHHSGGGTGAGLQESTDGQARLALDLTAKDLGVM